VDIFNSIPDMVLDSGAMWPRVLLELFRSKGAKEIDGIFRNDH
jgi:hypothetical protein